MIAVDARETTRVLAQGDRRGSREVGELREVAGACTAMLVSYPGKVGTEPEQGGRPRALSRAGWERCYKNGVDRASAPERRWRFPNYPQCKGVRSMRIRCASAIRRAFSSRHSTPRRTGQRSEERRTLGSATDYCTILYAIIIFRGGIRRTRRRRVERVRLPHPRVKAPPSTMKFVAAVLVALAAAAEACDDAALCQNQDCGSCGNAVSQGRKRY